MAVPDYQSLMLPVGRPDVMQFAGALQAQKASKGIFITTSRFTDDARTYVSQIGSKIVLIDGEQLSNLIGARGHITYPGERSRTSKDTHGVLPDGNAIPARSPNCGSAIPAQSVKLEAGIAPGALRQVLVDVTGFRASAGPDLPRKSDRQATRRVSVPVNE